MKAQAIIRIALASVGLAIFAGAATVARATGGGEQRAAAAGTIKGHVRLTGKLPGNPVIRMGMDPKCSQMNAGKMTIQETVVAAIDGSLANVFVALDGSFPAVAVPSQAVTLDQRACVYRPRVLGLRAGQTLQIHNSDDLLHNVHSSTARGNRFNISQPKAGVVQQIQLKDEELMVHVACDVHRWMNAYIGVVSHPYFAVTDAPGSFTIANVPPGSYTIRAWQERYGFVSKTVRVNAGATATVDFSYTGNEKASSLGVRELLLSADASLTISRRP